MKPWISLAAVATLSLVGGCGESTQQTPQHPCLPDIQWLCAGIEPGGGRLATCLLRQEAKLSVACRKSLRR